MPNLAHWQCPSNSKIYHKSRYKLLTVEGAYRNGEIKLAEIPENVEQADVLVIFLKTKKNPSTPPSSVNPPKSRIMTFGQFAGETKTNEDDFRLAEWRGEPEFEDGE